MKAWKVDYVTRHGAVYKDVCTRWNDVLFIKRMHEILEIQEITL